ncbi:hypothetical protein PPL_05789 [Heterostelium album PN500]|uniref:Uncharacterized protein n=1 Tax=Heterostelium pallidum (strain ATCC 26659 / Pp 5 / PN500) TaxID=670386 RepID=D3BB57_HETP5|nr:hypothetical protein PPL_05789 [Heterostelium album PN500]EFA81794.1 hypothetical protein PPL_05789 [Heterostelium album PN500]|eukprot:XP_020433911.1 hypothetical protein PPL_05789 [Heterostelium album PN500]
MLLNNYLYNILIKYLWNCLDNIQFNDDNSVIQFNEHRKWCLSSVSLVCWNFYKITRSLNDSISLSSEKIDLFLQYKNKNSIFSNINTNQLYSLHIDIVSPLTISESILSSLFNNINILSLRFPSNHGSIQLSPTIHHETVKQNNKSIRQLTINYNDDLSIFDSESFILTLLSLKSLEHVCLKVGSDPATFKLLISLPSYCSQITTLELVDYDSNGSISWEYLNSPQTLFGQCLSKLTNLKSLKIELKGTIAFLQMLDQFQDHLLAYLKTDVQLKRLSLFRRLLLMNSKPLLEFLFQQYQCLEELEIGSNYIFPIEIPFKKLSLTVRNRLDDQIIQSFNRVKSLTLYNKPQFNRSYNGECDILTRVIQLNQIACLSITFQVGFLLIVNNQLIEAINNNQTLQYLYITGNIKSKEKLSQLLDIHPTIRNKI